MKSKSREIRWGSIAILTFLFAALFVTACGESEQANQEVTASLPDFEPPTEAAPNGPSSFVTSVDAYFLSRDELEPPAPLYFYLLMSAVSDFEIGVDALRTVICHQGPPLALQSDLPAGAAPFLIPVQPDMRPLTGNTSGVPTEQELREFRSTSYDATYADQTISRLGLSPGIWLIASVERANALPPGTASETREDFRAVSLDNSGPYAGAYVQAVIREALEGTLFQSSQMNRDYFGYITLAFLYSVGSVVQIFYSESAQAATDDQQRYERGVCA